MVATTKGKTAETSVNLSLPKMTEAKAFSLLNTYMEGAQENQIRLGGVIAEIYENDWKGDHDSVEERLLLEFGMGRRKSHYYMSIYKNLSELNIPSASLKGIGWTKLGMLAPILTSKNYKGWLSKAKKMTWLQLQDAIKAYKAKAKKAAKEGGDLPEVPDDSNITTFTVKCTKDQKQNFQKSITKAKKQINSKDPAEALDIICSSFMQTAGGNKKAQVSEFLKSLGVNEAYKLLTKTFSEFEWEDYTWEDESQEEQKEAA